MKTYKVIYSGNAPSITTFDFDEALFLLYPILMDSTSAGHIECCETGEVLISVENGQTTYIEESIMCKMLDDLFENAPELAIQTCLNMLVNCFE